MKAASLHPPRALEDLRVNVIVERARARLSQTDLAERAGVARPTISRIERAVGDVGIDVVQRIADALGVTVASLFVPPSTAQVDDDELARRAALPQASTGTCAISSPRSMKAPRPTSRSTKPPPRLAPSIRPRGTAGRRRSLER